MKTFIYIIIAIAVITGAFFTFNKYIYNEKQGEPAITDPRNGTYVVNGEAVTLKDGVSEVAIPNSSAKVVTRYFGNELKADLNSDGREDTFFLLTQETGGSGTLYYAVGAVNTPEGYVGTEAVLIGDRIAPQSTKKGEGSIVVVNYAVRKAGEAFTVAPSVGKSIWLKLDPVALQFGEVVRNFEGEADPDRMTLGMTKWSWIKTTVGGVQTVPKKANAFTITFNTTGGRFSATTDCNAISGQYTVSGKNISFTKMISTKMFCEASQEGEYADMLTNASSYIFTSRGELILTLKNGGTAVFR